MTRRSVAALAVAFGVLGLALSIPHPAVGQCLDRTACREIKSEFSELKPDLRAARRAFRQFRESLKALPKGSDPWLAKRDQARRAKRSLRALKRELRALKQDYRHQGCASC